MIIDKSSASTSRAPPPNPQSDTAASNSDRKLSIELPTPRQIYTIGSTVSGIIHLSTKNTEQVLEVQVSLVCVVRSYHHRYYGGSTYDIRRETTKLIHRDQTLWARPDIDLSIPPADLGFQITIPDFGNDRRGNDAETPLPPSFHAGRQSGWKNPMSGSPIGFVKYYVKASVSRKGMFKRKERAIAPLIFLPPSPPPPLLAPTPPDVISEQDLYQRSALWDRESTTTTLRQAIFSSCGHAVLALWLPSVSSFPRLTRIPVFLCLALQTRPVKSTCDKTPPNDMLPPPPQLDKASLHLRIHIRTCAKGGVQSHTKPFDKNPTDNLLHGVTPLEGTWTLKAAQNGDAYWEKGYMWRCLWTFREAPNFTNRQLEWKYALVADVPIKGLGNGVKLVSRDLDITSGVTAGMEVVTTPDQGDILDLPPDYFDVEGNNDDDYDDDKDEKN